MLFQIQQDFRQIYNTSPDLFMQNWPTYASKIYDYACTKSDKSIKELIKNNPGVIRSGNIFFSTIL